VFFPVILSAVQYRRILISVKGTTVTLRLGGVLVASRKLEGPIVDCGPAGPDCVLQVGDGNHRRCFGQHLVIIDCVAGLWGIGLFCFVLFLLVVG